MKVLIIGATSAIAHETARLFAADKAELYLVGRDADRMTAVQNDLVVRGAKSVEKSVLDLADVSQHKALIDTAIATLGGLDSVLIAYGTLSDQAACEQSADLTVQELTINLTSVVSLLTLLANHFEPQRRGVIAAISSVAGDRGRRSNYVYGTAKGGLSIFMEGLRARMYKAGVSVVTIKPGFVDTPMTAHLKKNPLYASPEKVARDIYRAMQKGTDVLYVPWFWRYIMLIITLIPGSIFKRMNLK
ncbi:MAG: SDR family oxidoreductase [Anaerolineae bacterium]|nr:SDR family oxidoreductase [Anaerolineae bacterium]